MRTLEDLWLDAAEVMFKSNESAIEYEDARTIFYAGAVAYHTLLRTYISESPFEIANTGILATLDKELNDFFENLKES